MLQVKTQYLICILLFSSAALSGCSLNGVSGSDGSTSSQKDLQAARQILGESLSTDDSGIILSLHDALTVISKQYFLPEPIASTHSKGDRSGRGRERNYSHSYRQQSGIHVVSFQRQTEDPLFSKSVSDNLRYNFRDASGTNIEFPSQNREQIRTIYFNSRREGQITRPDQQSMFVRQDTFAIKGLNSSTLSIDGVHHGKGRITLNPAPNSSFERFYELEVNLLNISAPRSAFNSAQSIWRDVSGTLSWQLSIRNGKNSATVKNMGGTIKMNGAGIALFNLQGNPDKFQINLDNGDVKNRDTEFEGKIKSINMTRQSIQLVNDRTLFLTESSAIDDDDYATIQEVQQALNNGITVWAEGEGFLEGEQFIISEVEFERDDDEEDADEDREELEFNEVLSAVNTTTSTFTLTNGVTVLVDDSTTINEDGDFTTLQEVSDAITGGQTVTADGEGYPAAEGSTADLTATDVKFEYEEKDNSGEED